MYIVVVGANHKTAPVEVRERLSFAKDRLPDLYSALLDDSNLRECIIISTCNRTEVYAASATDAEAVLDRIKDFLSRESGIDARALQHHLYELTCKKAIEHLFRVAAGLDSMILGENEVLGQVSEAYETACASKSSSTILNTLFQRAISVGKKVRTDTEICSGIVSVGSAAVQLAAEVFGRFGTGYPTERPYSVLLIGAGEIGELVARHVVSTPPAYAGVGQSQHPACKLTICNRSYDRAVELAGKIRGVPARLDGLPKYLAEVDIAISCTASPECIISTEQLRAAMEGRGNRPLFLVDIALPRDVEPGASKLENVHLYNIDDLQSIADEGLKQRQSALSDAERIIREKVDVFLRWLNSSSVTPVIRSLHDSAATVREEELTAALSKLGELTEREEKIIRSMAKSITSRLIGTPIAQLKRHAGMDQGHIYTQVARSLFDLSEDSSPNRVQEHSPTRQQKQT